MDSDSPLGRARCCATRASATARRMFRRRGLPRSLSRRRLSASSTLLIVGVVIAGVVWLSLSLGVRPALADGGLGGNDGSGDSGGAGGTGFTGNGGNAGAATGAVGAGGGGGGAGGGLGGAGGANAGSGGAGGSLGSPDGQAGTPGNASGSGGGGGGGGYNGNGAGVANLSNSSPSLTAGTGGAGGSAGASSGNGGGGGGGGAGGYGAVVTGSGASNNSGTITGGLGGAGGAGGATTGGGTPGLAGNGGDGNAGVLFTATGAIFTNTGQVYGGHGGAAGGPGAAAGAGGAGIVGAGLTIINSGVIFGGMSGDNTTQANAITFTGGVNTLALWAGSSIHGTVSAFSTADTLTLGGNTNATFDVSAGASQYVGFGNYVKTGASTWTLTNSTATTTPWTINQGTLAITANGSLGSSGSQLTFAGGTLQAAAGNLSVANNAHVNASGGTIDNNGFGFTYAGVISGPGGITITNSVGNAAGVAFTGNNTYTGGTTINPNSILQIGNGGTSGSVVGDILNNGAMVFGRADTVTFNGAISGSGYVQQLGSGALVLTGDNTYTGGTGIGTGTLTVGNNNALGTGLLIMAPGTTLSFLNTGNFNIANSIAINGDPTFTPPTGTVQTLSGVIADGFSPGTLELSGGGTLVLSAANTYTGATNVNSGVLDVSGSIATSSLTTVKSGAMLVGSGTVGNTQINSGATFAPGAPGAPGTSMTVSGNIAFQSGAIYLVQVNPTSASFANVTGAASLAGIVNAAFAPGSYVKKQYTILTAAGGLGGTTFSGLTSASLPPGFVASLSYDANDVFLNLSQGFSTSGLNVNQANVANALGNSFNTTGGIPAAFAGLSPGGLTQIDGEAATGAERSAFQMMTQFLGLMLDPFVNGRGGAGGAGGQAFGFAPEQAASLPPEIALAYNSVLRPPPPAPFDQRWTTWGAAYGGSNSAAGNAAVGSTNVTAQTFGFAAGMDYHLSRDTIVGFALAGGGTNWGLASGLGGGRSDAFQSGVYGISHLGPAYVAGALAFTNHWFTTGRSAFGDQLSASFDGQSYGGRLEGGYRYGVLPTLGVTPYAALQAQGFHTPSYSETDSSGGGFGLAYAAMNASDVRTELGGRLDAPMLVAGMPLVLRGRVAWAHDFVSNPALSAAFETLPGSAFTVNGAPIAPNSALTSAGAQLFLTPSLTLLAKFDGEFASGSQTYGGSGTLRYSW
jgi:autotransporter-associated beta strand protein